MACGLAGSGWTEGELPDSEQVHAPGLARMKAAPAARQMEDVPSDGPSLSPNITSDPQAPEIKINSAQLL